MQLSIIEAIPGGKGLMKRISLLEGGVISFKRIYPVWIAMKIQKENASAEVDKRFTRYEFRYDTTELNSDKMTIKNKSERLGQIYVLSNESIPDKFKIGIANNPEIRAKEIRIAFNEESKFIVAAKWLTQNPQKVEEAVYRDLEQYKDGDSGFFKCNLKKIRSTIKKHIQEIY